MIKFEIITVFARLIKRRRVPAIFDEFQINFSVSAARLGVPSLALHGEMRWASDTSKNDILVSTKFYMHIKFLYSVHLPWPLGESLYFFSRTFDFLGIWEMDKSKKTKANSSSIVVTSAYYTLVTTADFNPSSDFRSWTWPLDAWCSVASAMLGVRRSLCGWQIRFS